MDIGFKNDIAMNQSSLERTRELKDTLESIIQKEEQVRSESCPPPQYPRMSFVGSKTPGVMRSGVPPSMMTQTAQQQLLSPSGELLDVYGLPYGDEPHCSYETFLKVAEPIMNRYQDGSMSSHINHQGRGHLTTIPRSHGAATTLTLIPRSHGTAIGGNSFAMRLPLKSTKFFDKQAERESQKDQTEGKGQKDHDNTQQTPLNWKEKILQDDERVRYYAAIEAYPKGFASPGTFKMVCGSPYGGSMLGSRSDQGVTGQGCLQVAGRFTHVDTRGRTLDGLPTMN